MTVQAGLCRTWSEPKLFVFSRTGSDVKILHLCTNARVKFNVIFLIGYTGAVTRVKSSLCSSVSEQLCDWTVIETTAVCDDQLIVPDVNDDLKQHCQVYLVMLICNENRRLDFESFVFYNRDLMRNWFHCNALVSTAF